MNSGTHLTGLPFHDLPSYWTQPSTTACFERPIAAHLLHFGWPGDVVPAPLPSHLTLAPIPLPPPLTTDSLSSIPIHSRRLVFHSSDVEQRPPGSLRPPSPPRVCQPPMPNEHRRRPLSPLRHFLTIVMALVARNILSPNVSSINGESSRHAWRPATNFSSLAYKSIPPPLPCSRTSLHSPLACSALVVPLLWPTPMLRHWCQAITKASATCTVLFLPWSSCPTRYRCHQEDSSLLLASNFLLACSASAIHRWHRANAPPHRSSLLHCRPPASDPARRCRASYAAATRHRRDVLRLHSPLFAPIEACRSRSCFPDDHHCDVVLHSCSRHPLVCLASRHHSPSSCVARDPHRWTPSSLDLPPRFGFPFPCPPPRLPAEPR